MKLKFDWKSIVHSVAPTIGTAIGGPIGGVATKFIAATLLGKPDATEKDIEEAIAEASPEMLAELKRLDKEFEAKMKELEIDVYELEVEDRKDARQMFKVNIWPQITLSGIFVAGYFGVLYILLSGGAMASMKNDALFGVFTTIIGVLTAAIPQILGFWFGSSMGSKEKNKKV
jgi:hypothetical protein